MAIDPGTKRVGIAISDPLQMIASPYSVLHYKDYQQVVKDLLAIIAEKQVVKVIIGYPLREDGTEGITSPLSHQLKAALEERNIVVQLYDERYSSFIAQQRLQQQGINSKKAKDKIDAMAATVILEDYLSTLK
ncbi:MAG: Holliday junction resolvase RuvX [Spirochaetales bacterium]|nr:Holliday junction resolvase RuvX [Spirochaetales bacterium]